MRCKNCGYTRFSANRKAVATATVIVDDEGCCDPAMYGCPDPEIEVEEWDGPPYGPYTCLRCEEEYESLNVPPEPIPHD